MAKNHWKPRPGVLQPVVPWGSVRPASQQSWGSWVFLGARMFGPWNSLEVWEEQGDQHGKPKQFWWKVKPLWRKDGWQDVQQPCWLSIETIFFNSDNYSCKVIQVSWLRPRPTPVQGDLAKCRVAVGVPGKGSEETKWVGQRCVYHTESYVPKNPRTDFLKLIQGVNVF